MFVSIPSLQILLRNIIYTSEVFKIITFCWIIYFFFKLFVL